MGRMLTHAIAWLNTPATAISFVYPLALIAFIFLISSIPTTEQPIGLSVTGFLAWIPPSLQNTLHVPVYALLAMLICRALRLWTLPVTVACGTAFMLAATCGFFAEWHQLSVHGRYATATDVLLNAAGAALGIWLHRRLTKPHEIRRS